MGAFIDLTGQKFGRLTVVARAKNKYLANGRQKVQWICKCDCGNEVTILAELLKNGTTKSCGCIKKEHPNRTTHGKRYTRLYTIWRSMKQRCYDKNHKSYVYYGKRGITVCNEWLHDFQTFFDWAIQNGYKDDLTIERIDGNKGYIPENCCWATRKEQANNIKSNHFLTYNSETHTLAEWSKIKNISYSTLVMRIKRGWTIEQALNTP